MPNKEEAILELAGRHYQVEPGITEIYRICGQPECETGEGEPIKLLEVNEDTIPAGIMPLGFDAAPAAGIPYPAIIVEVTPGEMAKIRARELPLPHGWVVGALLPRPRSANGKT